MKSDYKTPQNWSRVTWVSVFYSITALKMPAENSVILYRASFLVILIWQIFQGVFNFKCCVKTHVNC